MACQCALTASNESLYIRNIELLCDEKVTKRNGWLHCKITLKISKGGLLTS